MKYQLVVAIAVALMCGHAIGPGAAGGAEPQPTAATVRDALDLLQLAAMQVARGQNAEAEVSCRRPAI